MSADAEEEEMEASDHELFIEMLVKLDGTHESVKAASKWCRANAKHHDVIVKTWFWALAKSRTMDRRLDLFHLASDILFTADKQSLPFFCSFLPILVKAIPLVRGEEIKLSMTKLLSLWREKNIYNKAVMDELDKSLRNRNKVVDDDVFFYDRDALMVHSDRVYRLKPAVDYLVTEVDNSPSFDNIQAILGGVKDRQTCASLFRAVDNEKKQVKVLVEFLEEMVHLLKMTTVDLDMAANREQNGVEAVKLKLMGYERFGQKVRSVQDTLISVHHVPPPAKKPPERKNELLFERRPATKNPEAQSANWLSPDPAVAIGSSTPLRESNYVEPNFMAPQPMGGFFAPATNVIRPLFTPQIPCAAPVSSVVPARESYEPTVGSRTPLRDEGYSIPMEARRYSFPSGVGLHDNWAGSSTPVTDEMDISTGSQTPRRDSFEISTGSLTPRNEDYEASWRSESYSGPNSIPVASDPRARRSMPVYSMASNDTPSGASTPTHDPFTNAPPTNNPAPRRPPLLPTPVSHEFVADRRRASTPGRELGYGGERGRASGRDFFVQDRSRAMTPGRDYPVQDNHNMGPNEGQFFSRRDRGRTPGRDFPVQDRSRAMTPGREYNRSIDERGRTPGRDFPVQDRSRAVTPGRDFNCSADERGRTPGRDFPAQNRSRTMTPGRERAMTPGRDICPSGEPMFSRRDRASTPGREFPVQDRSRAMTPGRERSVGPGGDRGRTPGRDFPAQNRSRARDRSRGRGRGRAGRDFPGQDRSRAMTPRRDRSLGPGDGRGRTPGRDFPAQNRSRVVSPGRNTVNAHDRSRAVTPGRDSHAGPSVGNPDSPKGENTEKTGKRGFPTHEQEQRIDTEDGKNSSSNRDQGTTSGLEISGQDKGGAMSAGNDQPKTQVEASLDQNADNTSSDGELPSSKESGSEKSPERPDQQPRCVTQEKDKSEPSTQDKVSDPSKKDGTVPSGKSTPDGVSTAEKTRSPIAKQDPAPKKDSLPIKKDSVKAPGENPTTSNRDNPKTDSTWRKASVKASVQDRATERGNRAQETFRGNTKPQYQRGRTPVRDFSPKPGARFAQSGKAYNDSSSRGRGKFIPRGKSVRPDMSRDRHSAKQETHWKRMVPSQGQSSQRDDQYQAEQGRNVQQGQERWSGPNQGQSRGPRKRVRARRNPSLDSGSAAGVVPWEPFEQRKSLPSLLSDIQGENLFDKFNMFDRARSATPTRGLSHGSGSMSPRNDSYSVGDTSWGSYWGGSDNSSRPVYQPRYTGLVANDSLPNAQIRPLMSNMLYGNDVRPQGSSAYLNFPQPGFRQ